MPHPFDAFQAAPLAQSNAFLTRMRGRIGGLGNTSTADAKQHVINPYVNLCGKNRTANPF